MTPFQRVFVATPGCTSREINSPDRSTWRSTFTNVRNLETKPVGLNVHPAPAADSRYPTCGTNPASARKPSPTSLNDADESPRVVLWLHWSCPACEVIDWPVHSCARSGRFGVRVSLTSHCPVIASVAFGRHWKSGPTTRLYEAMPRPSRSVTSMPTNERPMSRLALPTKTVEAKSWDANDEPRAPGSTTLPPPSSSATSAA